MRVIGSGRGQERLSRYDLGAAGTQGSIGAQAYYRLAAPRVSVPRMDEARTLDSLRLIGAGGTNKVMAGELSRLCRRALSDVRLPEPKKAGTGALVYPMDPRVARVAALYHRTSSRVLWDIFETRATRLEPLYDDLVRLMRDATPRVLWDGARLSVYAHGVTEFAAGERQIVGTVKNGLIEAARLAGMTVTLDVDAPTLVFAVRLEEGVLRVSVDLAGRPMNQRGYRTAQGAAPLREDLAAVLLMLARFDARTEALLDPMAGSGTIAIEAACMAQARPVFVPERKPLLLGMPSFAEVLPAGTAPLFADTEPCVLASDADPSMCEIIETAASTALVGEYVHARTADFRDIDPGSVYRAARRACKEQCLIVCNPPYGERLGDPDLLELYADLASFCESLGGIRAAFLVANPDFERAFGHSPTIKKPMSNGPLRGYFYLYEL